MLIFSRKKNESAVICDDILVTVAAIRRDRVRLHVQRPEGVPVQRIEWHGVARRTVGPKGSKESLFPCKNNQGLVINDDIFVKVVEICDDKVRLGFESPKEIPIYRREVFDAIMRRDEVSEPSHQEPKERNGRKPSNACPTCGHKLVRVIWRTGRLSGKNLQDIKAGAAILGPQDEKGPSRVCSHCVPAWSKVHELAMANREVQIEKDAAVETASRCRKAQVRLRRQLAVLLDELLRHQ